MRISPWRAPGMREPRTWAQQTRCDDSSRLRAVIVDLLDRASGSPRSREAIAMATGSWRLFAAGAALLGLVTAAAAESEVDPAAVSEGLKAIFKYGNGSKETADRLNANTVTIMSGTIAGTYVQFGADLASALDDGDNLRVLAIVGRGS